MDRRKLLQIAAAALLVAATALPAGVGATGSIVGQAPPPDASRLQAEALRAAREFRASLTESQRQAVVALLERQGARLAAASARLAVAPGDPGEQVPIKMGIAVPGPAELEELRRITAEIDREYSQVLTPGQREKAPTIPAQYAVSAPASNCYQACHRAEIGLYYAHLTYAAFGTANAEAAYVAGTLAHFYCSHGLYSMTHLFAKKSEAYAYAEYKATWNHVPYFAYVYEGWTRYHALLCSVFGD
jgi:hypothetical protein